MEKNASSSYRSGNSSLSMKPKMPNVSPAAQGSPEASANAQALKTRSAAPKSNEPHAPELPTKKPTNEQIAQRAYQHWEKSGSSHGDDQTHWYTAEKELSDANADGSPKHGDDERA